MRLPDNPILASLTVKGEPMSNAEAYRIICEDLSIGGLDYSLPAYRRFLLDNNR
jgi:hypothetical protein